VPGKADKLVTVPDEIKPEQAAMLKINPLTCLAHAA
jgi:hypothetical protein